VRLRVPSPTAEWGFASCFAVACSVSRDLRYAAASPRIADFNVRCRRLFAAAGASCSTRALIRSSPAAASITRAAFVLLLTESVYWPKDARCCPIAHCACQVAFSFSAEGDQVFARRVRSRRVLGRARSGCSRRAYAIATAGTGKRGRSTVKTPPYQGGYVRRAVRRWLRPPIAVERDELLQHMLVLASHRRDDQ
jgi:hypothetical protein